MRIVEIREKKVAIASSLTNACIDFVPHGGHPMSLNLAAGLHRGGNESYPGVGFKTKAELFKVMKSLGD